MSTCKPQNINETTEICFKKHIKSFEILNLFQEYGEFLEERKKIVEEQKKMLQEKREAKMLRTA